MAGPPGPCAIIPVSRFPEVCATAGTWEVLAGEIRVKLPSRCWEGGDPIAGKRRCHSGLCHRGRRGQSSASHSLHEGLRGGHCSWFRGGKGPGNTWAALCCGGFGGGSHGELRVASRNASGSSRGPPPSRLCQCQALASPTWHSRMPRNPCRAGRLRWERWNPCARAG